MLKKIEVFLLYIIIFTIPFNIRHIFNFVEVQVISGFKEHLTIFLSLFDILFIILLTLAIWNNRKKILKRKLLKELIKQPLIYFIILTSITTFYNQQGSAFIKYYKLIKFSEIIIFFVIIRSLLKHYTVLTYSKFIIFTAGVLQAIIAIIQFITQKSIGLILLGESILGPNIFGVAKFNFEGEKFIRAYGTFPHPNILGIFLLFSLGTGLSLVISKKKLLYNFRLPYKSIFFTEFIILYIGILLTYSRSAIILTVAMSLVFAYTQRNFINKIYKNFCKQLHIPFFLQTTFAIIIIFTTLFASYNILAPRLCVYCPNDKSLSFRKIYLQGAEMIILKHPIIGSGLNNFIPTFQVLSLDDLNNLKSWQLQPVHNLYLLIASETGLIGLCLFLIILIFYTLRTLKIQVLLNYPLDLLFILILLAGFFDHYFWTLHQGQIIFWTVLALVSLPKTEKIDSPKYHFKTVLKNVRQLLKELS